MSNQILSIKEAIAYMLNYCKKAESWGNPKRNLEQHVNRGNLAHEEERTHGKPLQFSLIELNRFIKWLDTHPLPKGGHRIQFSPETLALFGKIPDSKIADLVGCHRSTVFRHRHALNIPAAPRPKAQPQPTSDSSNGHA